MSFFAISLGCRLHTIDPRRKKDVVYLLSFILAPITKIPGDLFDCSFADRVELYI